MPTNEEQPKRIKITAEKVREMLHAAGREVSLRQATEILELLRIIARLEVEQYLKE